MWKRLMCIVRYLMMIVHLQASTSVERSHSRFNPKAQASGNQRRSAGLSSVTRIQSTTIIIFGEDAQHHHHHSSLPPPTLFTLLHIKPEISSFYIQKERLVYLDLTTTAYFRLQWREWTTRSRPRTAPARTRIRCVGLDPALCLPCR